MLPVVIRWTARVWSIASIGLMLVFLAGEGFDPSQITPAQALGFVFFPVGITLGMVLAWWKEGPGAVMTVASLAAFYLARWATSGAWPRGWAFLVFAMPGFLFLLYWMVARRVQKIGVR